MSGTTSAVLAVSAACAVVFAVLLACGPPPARPARDDPPAPARRRIGDRFVRPSRRARRLDAALPDVLDLLVVSLQAGLPVRAAFDDAAAAAAPAARPALLDVVGRIERGDRVVDALPLLAEHWGTRALGLVAAVSAAEVAGLPLAPTLDRIADDARAHRRRVAEADARRLPVRLALPLVCCTLPSFVCIAIGPLLVGALSSLRSV